MGFARAARRLVGPRSDLDTARRHRRAENALAIPGTRETTLLERVPDDLRGTAAVTIGPDKPFRALYRTDHEYAAELSNRTVHGVLHLGWVEQDDGRYRGQMAVLVKPRGRFGQAYMAFIKPFRYALVYPALLGIVDRAWQRRTSRQPRGWRRPDPRGFPWLRS